MRLLYIGGRVPKISPCVVLEAAVSLKKRMVCILLGKIGLLDGAGYADWLHRQAGEMLGVGGGVEVCNPQND